MTAKYRTVIMLFSLVFLMTLLVAFSVPLYNLFCRVTGYGGTTSFSETSSPITLDKDIEYYKYNTPLKKIKNNQIVMEVKNTDRVCSNIIINQFPFIKIRFSKFSIAIQDLYNKVY